MKITFEIRRYHIQDKDDKYEVTYIMKHSYEEFNHKHIGSIYKWVEHEDLPELTGYSHFFPTPELVGRIEELLKQSRDEN